MPLELNDSAFLPLAFDPAPEFDANFNSSLEKLYDEPSDYGVNFLRNTLNEEDQFTLEETEILDKFNNQLDLLSTAFAVVCVSLDISEELITDFYAFMDRLKSRKYYAGQSAKFYGSCKKYVEGITLQAQEVNQDNKIPVKILIENVLTEILHCSSGVRYQLEKTNNLLSDDRSLKRAIAEFRTLIIEQLASEHLVSNSLHKVDITHINNVFIKDAVEQGWNPLGHDAQEDFNEVHAALADVSDNDLVKFHKDFFERFTPEALINYLADTLRSQLIEKIKNISVLREVELPLAFEKIDELQEILNNFPVTDINCFFHEIEIQKDLIVNIHTKWGTTGLALKSIPDIKLALLQYFSEMDAPLFKGITKKSSYGLVHNSKSLGYVIENNELLPLSAARLPLQLSLNIFRDNKTTIFPAQFSYFLEKNVKHFEYYFFEDIDFRNLNSNVRITGSTLTNCCITATQYLNWGSANAIISLRQDENEIAELLLTLTSSYVKYEKLLHYAVAMNHPRLISKLIEIGADQDLLDLSGRTALKVAFELKYWDCFTALMENVIIAENDIVTFVIYLIEAALENQTKAALKLLQHPELVVYSQNGNTALHNAALHGDPILIEALITAGYDPLQLNSDSLNAIQIAANHSHWDAIKIVIEKKSGNEYFYGFALILALVNNVDDIVELLTQENCQLDWEDGRGNRPLSIALRNKNLFNTKAILNIMTPEDILQNNTDGSTPIQILLEDPDINFIALFAEKSCFTLFTIEELKIVFAEAEKTNHREIFVALKLLPDFTQLCSPAEASLRLENTYHEGLDAAIEVYLHFGADVKKEYIEEAMLNSHWKSLNYLLRSIDTNDKDFLNLMFFDLLAVKQFDLAKILLHKGVDVNRPITKNGSTPLHWAALHGEINFFIALLQHGAAISLKNSNDETAFDLTQDKAPHFLQAIFSDYFKLPIICNDRIYDYKYLFVNQLLNYLMLIHADTQRSFKRNLKLFFERKVIFTTADIVPMIRILNESQTSVELDLKLSHFMTQSAKLFHKKFEGFLADKRVSRKLSF